MTLSIRNPQADSLARRLAEIDKTSITEAVITALEETLTKRLAKESPGETANRILAKHGLAFRPGRKPVPTGAYHELDHDLNGKS